MEGGLTTCKMQNLADEKGKDVTNTELGKERKSNIISKQNTSSSVRDKMKKRWQSTFTPSRGMMKEAKK